MTTNFYSTDPQEEKEIFRYAFLCGYGPRNDAEEKEVRELEAKYFKLVGWPVVPRVYSKEGAEE